MCVSENFLELFAKLNTASISFEKRSTRMCSVRVSHYPASAGLLLSTSTRTATRVEEASHQVTIKGACLASSPTCVPPPDCFGFPSFSGGLGCRPAPMQLHHGGKIPQLFLFPYFIIGNRSGYRKIETG